MILSHFPVGIFGRSYYSIDLYTENSQKIKLTLNDDNHTCSILYLENHLNRIPLKRVLLFPSKLCKSQPYISSTRKLLDTKSQRVTYNETMFCS